MSDPDDVQRTGLNLAAEARRNAEAARERGRQAMAKAEAEAQRWEHIAAQIDAEVVEVREGLLTTPRNNATLATNMEAENRQTRVSRSRLRKDNRKHPFIAALVKEHLTVTDVAKSLGYSRSTVQSWYDADESNGRPIPRSAAEAIRDKHGVPLSAWRRIVD